MGTDGTLAHPDCARVGLCAHNSQKRSMRSSTTIKWRPVHIESHSSFFQGGRRARLFGCQRPPVGTVAVGGGGAARDVTRHHPDGQGRPVRCRPQSAAPRDGRGGGGGKCPPARLWRPARRRRVGRLRRLPVCRRHGRRRRVAAGPAQLPPQSRRPPPSSRSKPPPRPAPAAVRAATRRGAW